MDLLDDEQNIQSNKKSKLIIFLAILTIIGSILQGLLIFIQLTTIPSLVHIIDMKPTYLIEIFKYRLIGNYIWIGANFLTLLAAVLIIFQRRIGIYIYATTSVLFIILTIIFFLVLGDLSKYDSGVPFFSMNLIEILCIISSLVFLFLYSMNYKKHCK